jgi:N-acetylneuraminic acid mutarotase
MEAKSRSRGLFSLAIALTTMLSLCFGTAGVALAASAAPAAPAKAAPATKAAPKLLKHITVPSCKAPKGAPKKGTPPQVGCDLVPATDSTGQTAVTSAPPTQSITPANIKSAYNLPNAGAGQTVAIVDAFGDPTAEADLAVYRSYYGLPACTTANGCFTKLDQFGGTNYPLPNVGWEQETSLDLDAVSAACPLCKIVLVQARSAFFTDTDQAENEAANLHPAAISNSYGGSEYDGQTANDPYYDHPGIAVVASAGDSGSGPGAQYPASDPNITAVGGTTLTADSSAPRGWDETAWNGTYTNNGGATGSGCSAVEPKPVYQNGLNDSCPNHRAYSDVSADADPYSGLGVYSSANGGWDLVGGTSLAAPLVAGMYAMAGTPVPGTYPVSYPYQHPGALNDVTTGDNWNLSIGGSVPVDCGTAVCDAGPGWDGPTGLGTPNGVAALSLGAYGQAVGTITDDSGATVSGASVVATDSKGNSFSVTTGTKGTYDLYAPVGSYTLAASKFGYTSQTVTGVAVTANASVTQNVTIPKVPSETVSGTVTDGSGHGWAMRAKITVSGYPYGAIYSDPYTGAYSVTLPVGSYTLKVSAVDLPDYQDQSVTVNVGSQPVTENFALQITAACTADGYAVQSQGLIQSFTGWSGNTPQQGWNVADNVGNGEAWTFSGPQFMAPDSNGNDYNFASINSGAYATTDKQDTTLTSPVIDLTGVANPSISWDDKWQPYADNDVLTNSATVDVSYDGGTTWTTLYNEPNVNLGGAGPNYSRSSVSFAGGSDVRVRFHYVGGAYNGSWAIDNVNIGTPPKCAPTPGGLVAGVVTDANTGGALNGATIASNAVATQYTATVATADDPALPGGYYELFSPQPGQTGFTATDGQYTPATVQVNVPADGVAHQDIKLDAGRLTVGTPSVSMTATLGSTATGTVTLGNNGTAPLNVTLGSAQSGTPFTPMGLSAGTAAGNVPTKLVKVKAVVGPETAKTATGDSLTTPVPGLAGGSWAPIANWPGNPNSGVNSAAAASYNGKVYVVGGYAGGAVELNQAYMFDPTAGTWTKLASMPVGLQYPSAQFIGGTLYVTGGWDASGVNVHTYAYHPSTNTWSQLADMPGGGVAAAGSAVIDGDLYIIGGCGGACAPMATAVWSYDPVNNTWAAAPDYPQEVGYLSCGGLTTEIVCAGGLNGGGSLNLTYSYTPGDATWTQRANMPVDAWAAGYTVANGQLDVLGGMVQNSSFSTNQNEAYDPASDTWNPLPNSPDITFKAAAACGIYQIGGEDASTAYLSTADTLPGYDRCGGGDNPVSWMTTPSTLTIAPGQSVAVTVTGNTALESQPGTYQGQLLVRALSPYTDPAPETVTMNVTPPKTWGKIAGTVVDASGAPIPGATLSFCTSYVTSTASCGPVTYTTWTDAKGNYTLWTDKGYSPLEVIASDNGYTSVMQTAKVTAGKTTTLGFTLKAATPATP